MYDVIVVGARCAGSATATLLARHGHSVLLLDADSFPSDFQGSTHLLWQSGVARLASWGLLNRLKATGCPPIRKITLDLGMMSLEGNAPPADGVDVAFCPRRIVLDGLLQDAAREAGVEFASGAQVRDLVWTDGRVSGVSWMDAGGTAGHASSRMVVGADGANSTVARIVNATVAEEHPRLEGVIWSYFDNVPSEGMEFYARPRRMLMVYPTNDGQTLIGSCVHQEDYPALARDADTQMPAEMQALAPSLAARVQAGTQDGRWLTRSVKGFRRRATGPGWALVGDAGLTMDPITAAGITNAFRDADLLSAAIHDGLASRAACDQVVERFGGERDAVSVPLFEFARESARLEPPPPPIMALFAAMPGQQSAIEDYFGVFAQTVPVTTFFSEANFTKILARAGQTAGM
jgi:2-polyprenyl-6-methoxyphenol hydroxylase-like FAD-dependent oxidoreductase